MTSKTGSFLASAKASRITKNPANGIQPESLAWHYLLMSRSTPPIPSLWPLFFLRFPPAALAVKLRQAWQLTNRTAGRKRFNVRKLAADLKEHACTLPEAIHHPFPALPPPYQ